MTPQVRISDIAIWIKHVENPQLRARLRSLPDDEYINLETDGVVGRWVRMKTGKDFVICERYETIVVPFPFSDVPVLTCRF